MPQPDKPKSSYQIELERRAEDLLRVHNPTDERWRVEWDRKNGTKVFPVEPNSDEILVRYIATKYVKEYFFKYIHWKAEQEVKKENERRLKNGMAEMDKTAKTGEVKQFEGKFYGINDEDILTIMEAIEDAQVQGKEINPDHPHFTNLQKEAVEIVSKIYKGIEKEYGVDRQDPQSSGSIDFGDILKESSHAVEANSEPVQEEPKETAEIKQLYECDECDFTTEHKIALSGHKKSHEKK